MNRMDKMEYDLAGRVIGLGMKVHSKLDPGFLESVYQNALVHELRVAQLSVETSLELQVRYDGVVVGSFVADLLSTSCSWWKTKERWGLAIAHEVQLVNYLTARA